jgi:hypothetical protein
MNTFEVSILIADLTILIAGFAMFNHFNKRQKRQGKIIASLNERVFEVESSQRYERKFEIAELKNKLETLEVKLSKASFDLAEYKYFLHTKQQAETLAKNVMKSIAESKSSSQNEGEDDWEKKETKPSESVQNKVVDLIRKDNKERITLTRKVARKRVKTNIKTEDIEVAFIEKYNMTFYGYRQKFGEESFKKAKYYAYQRAYYVKVKKQKLITK